MKFFTNILTIVLILFIFNLNAQNSEKYTDALVNNINNSEDLSELTVWIFFTDKGSEIESKILSAKNNLSQKSIERRQKLIRSGSVVDFHDIPVEENYLLQINPHLIKLRHQSKWLNAISAEVSKNSLMHIAEMNFVKKIDIVRKGSYNLQKQIINKKVNTVETFLSPMYDLDYGQSLTQVEQINVPIIHDMGYNGTGIIICVLDAGFNNLEHQVFSNMNILDQWDFVNNDGNVDDEADMGSGNHGTMTLSTLGGFYEGQLIGPAYGASYLLAKTENTDSETQIEEDNWVAGAEWADALGADITSTSLSYTDFDDGSWYSPAELDGNTAVITIASDIAAGKGILVVNSAGNYGSGVTTIGAPADGDSVLAVGAVESNGTRSSFSSVGPTGDGRIKPEVMAMGSNVYMASPPSGNDYTYANGTSFSCPLTAGAAAILWEMIPNASNMDIFEALKITADNASNPNNQYGWGIIDIYEAYNYLIQIFPYTVTFNVSDGVNPIENANVNFISQDILTDASGQAVFTNIASGEDFNYTVSKTGYDVFSGTLSVTDQNVEENVILSLTAGINNVISENKFVILPNPSNDYIDIKANMNFQIEDVIIYNISGQIQKYFSNNNLRIDVSDLSPGIYFAKIIGTNQTSISKFIIQR